KPKDKPTAGGKAKKKKWSRVKQREQLNNMPLFDQATYEKVKKEVPFRYVTPSLLSDRFKIRLSLAKRALRELEKENRLRIVTKHHAQIVYTRTSDA
ncbi:eS25 family ribosomal protein, partial [Salmonella sp. s51228]|uniref:eS25 family ribosomal protein n=1 Tax=Salmonella sp. s51228 TaxID=3159652 RepID=UPI003981844F